jgi:hypothetical protein
VSGGGCGIDFLFFIIFLFFSVLALKQKLGLACKSAFVADRPQVLCVMCVYVCVYACIYTYVRTSARALAHLIEDIGSSNLRYRVV